MKNQLNTKTRENRFCIECKENIDDRGNRSIRCKQCQINHRIQYKKKWWMRNSNRYGDRWISQIGTNDTKTYEEWKNNERKGKYQALKDEEFTTNNEAYATSVYVNQYVGTISERKIISEADKYRWITPEMEGYYWDPKCWDWVTEKPEFFFVLELSDSTKKSDKKIKFKQYFFYLSALYMRIVILNYFSHKNSF